MSLALDPAQQVLEHCAWDLEEIVRADFFSEIQVCELILSPRRPRQSKAVSQLRFILYCRNLCTEIHKGKATGRDPQPSQANSESHSAPCACWSLPEVKDMKICDRMHNKQFVGSQTMLG
eukprot:3315535-Amphidinium_carterae.1